MLSIQEINLLKSQNEALKKQNNSLQKEVRRKDEQLNAISNELDEYVQKLSKPEFELLLQDDYFKGLNVNQILELAKKSIRLTAENRELENKLEEADAKTENLIEKCYGVITDISAAFDRGNNPPFHFEYQYARAALEEIIDIVNKFSQNIEKIDK